MATETKNVISLYFYYNGKTNKTWVILSFIFNIFGEFDNFEVRFASDVSRLHVIQIFLIMDTSSGIIPYLSHGSS